MDNFDERKWRRANLMQNGAKKKDIALYFSQFIENV